MEKNPRRVLCFVCGNPIHGSEWKGVSKEGYFHEKCYESTTKLCNEVRKQESFPSG